MSYLFFMKTRLILTLDSKVIESAKAYARSKGVTLSKLIEDFLRTLKAKKESRD